MKNIFIKTAFATVVYVLAIGQGKAQTTAQWQATNALLVAKSTTVLIEYSPVSDKSTAAHKYKLFDVAFGKSMMEASGRLFFAYGSRFIIMDDKYISVYNVEKEKPSVAVSFLVSEISKSGYKDIEIIGFTKKGMPILRLVGSEEATYYTYNTTSRTSRKLNPPKDFHKAIFMPQSGDFVYLVHGTGNHVCYRYNPDNDEVKVAGTLKSVPDEKSYRVQLSPNNEFAIYGGSYVYDLAKGTALYQLPVSNEDINWGGNKMTSSGQKVTTSFSAKGDSVIIVKRLKDNATSPEKIQIEIHDTASNASVKSFFFNFKGDVMADVDINSGWATFLSNGKVKVVHLTTKATVREFSLLTPDLGTQSGLLPVKTTTTSSN